MTALLFIYVNDRECTVCDEGRCFHSPDFIIMRTSPSVDYYLVSVFIYANFFALFGVFANYHSKGRKIEDIYIDGKFCCLLTRHAKEIIQ